MSDYTKKLKNEYDIAALISLCLTIGPLLVTYIYAWVSSGTTEKLALGGTAIIAIVITLLNVMFKYNFRSAIWIMLIGIYLAMSNIITLLLIVAATTILDEFIVCPIKHDLKEKYHINREIDKRG